MSIKLLGKAWDTDQKGNDLLVLLALCDFANDEGVLYPSLPTICKKAKVGITTLKYILRAYEEIGVITRESRKRENGSNTSNIYQINTLSFDSSSYKKAYQKARKYICDKSQCDPLPKEENIKIVTPLDEIVTPLSANCDPLEPSILNRQVINHHKKIYTKKDDDKIAGLKAKDLITFYKENISELRSKIKEVSSTNAMALCADGLEEILIGLKNYANDLPKDKFHITNLEKFIKEKFYLDYQEPTRKNAPTNALLISDKKYTESEEF